MNDFELANPGYNDGFNALRGTLERAINMTFEKTFSETNPMKKPNTQPFELEYNYGFNDAYARGVKDNKWLSSATPQERHAYNEGYEAGLKRKEEEERTK